MTMYLVTGAGGGVGSVSRRVVEMLLEAGQSVRAMVHHDDARADRLRGIGAEVVVGDLANPADVAGAMRDVSRMFFNMSVSPEYLQATVIVCAVAREGGAIDVIVNMSQMTVSQMTLTSTEESRQHRLHWLAEHVMDWSGVPRVHLRPTVFVDNPLFTVLGMDSVRERDVLALPFGSGHTSPIAATDVARVASTVLLDPAQRNGDVYELTGPEVLD
ncbi:MAG: NAD(P)H-binding protein, partial [Mycobacterium sp.]